MSSPSEVSEKAVWLENNMPKWLVYCNIEAIDDVHDVMSVVLVIAKRAMRSPHSICLRNQYWRSYLA